MNLEESKDARHEQTYKGQTSRKKAESESVLTETLYVRGIRA